MDHLVYAILGIFGPALVMGVVMAIAGIVGAIMDFFSRLRMRWRRCAHGIAGGETQARCEICVDEWHTQNEAKQREKKRKQQEEEKRQQEEENRRRIQVKAQTVRQTELDRLSASILPTLEELRQLTPQRFEDEMAQLFRRLGYKVKQTPYSNDGGRDAIMTKDGEKFLLECKRYGERSLSGRPDIQKFHSAIQHEQAKQGFFVTTGRFSKDALEYKTTPPVELVGGHRLLRLMVESKPPSSGNDAYSSICQQCGDVVRHCLRMPETVTCRHGHDVQPTIGLNDVFGRGDFLSGTTQGPPLCLKCGTPMRVIDGRSGKFWGCSRYPTCRSTRPFKGSSHRRHDAWRSSPVHS